MNYSRLSFLLLGIGLLWSSSFKSQLYQVISAHPHDIQEISPFIETVRQDGRLWLVHLKKDHPAKILKFLRKTSGKDVKSYVPSESKFLSKSLKILDLTSKIDVNSIKSDVEMLSNYKTRLVGTPDNQKAMGKVEEIFTHLGYTVTQYCYRAGACSLIADKAGSKSDKVVMLMAHLDSVGKGFAGADDNASGVAVLLDVARVLKDYSNKKTFRFFITNGEESGLLGAKHYAEVLKSSGEISKIALAINMDMVGYNSNGVVELETDSVFEDLATWFADLVPAYTNLKSKITLGAWGSDHVPFINGGVPTLLTIEDWSTKTPCYHKECDKPSTLNYVYAGEIAKLNLAAMMTKDEEELIKFDAN